MSSTVLTCNIKHSRCFHTTTVSSPAFTPYRRDLQTTFPGQQRDRGERCWSVGRMNDFLQLQPDTLSVCVSESGTYELSSLPNHITNTGTVTGGPLAPLLCLNTHGGHTHTGNVHVFMHIYSICTGALINFTLGLQPAIINYFHYRLINLLTFFNQYILLCQEILNTNHSFPESKVMLSHCVFCPTRLKYSFHNNKPQRKSTNSHA